MAVDPGSKHVGVSLWQESTCVLAKEYTVEDTEAMLVDMVRGRVAPPDIFVVEEFRVEPARAAALAGSDLGVVQLIGMFRLTARLLEPAVELVLQPNKVLRVAQGWMTVHGYRPTSRGSGPHALDAERHGYFYVYRHALELD